MRNELKPVSELTIEQRVKLIESHMLILVDAVKNLLVGVEMLKRGRLPSPEEIQAQASPRRRPWWKGWN